MKKVLVTGGTGFIGGLLTEQLVQSGHQVRCLVRRTSKVAALRRLGVDLHCADLAKGDNVRDALRDVEVVYHLAGVTKALRRIDFYRGNVQATGHLARSCAEMREQGLAPISQFVHVSSLSASGPSPDGTLLTEERAPTPISLYGRSKLCAERELTALESRLPFTIVRPPIVYGPRDRDFYKIFESVAQGWVVQIGGGQKTYSLIHVDDLVRGIVLVGNSPVSRGQLYFLSEPVIHTWQDLISVLEAILQCHARRVSLPYFVGWLVGAASELISSLRHKADVLSRDKVTEGRSDHWICSPEKAANELDFRTEIPLKQGFQETADWYRQAGWL